MRSTIVADLTPIAGRLANLVRRLTSDKDGEVVATVYAIKRTLEGIDADLHDLAELIEQGHGALNEAESQQIYNAGREDERKRHGNGAALQMPSAQVMATYCFQNIDRLQREKDKEFVRSVVAQLRRRGATPRQMPWLEDLYLRLGGEV